MMLAWHNDGSDTSEFIISSKELCSLSTDGERLVLQTTENPIQPWNFPGITFRKVLTNRINIADDLELLLDISVDMTGITGDDGMEFSVFLCDNADGTTWNHVSWDFTVGGMVGSKITIKDYDATIGETGESTEVYGQAWANSFDGVIKISRVAGIWYFYLDNTLLVSSDFGQFGFSSIEFKYSGSVWDNPRTFKPVYMNDTKLYHGEEPIEPPPEPFQPWTPPKLEPSWWEGFKLPFNVLELDEDAPIAIQRNFKEIEHYINFLGKASGEIKDNLELLATAPAPMSEEEMPDPEPEVPPTDSYFAGYILGKEGQMGSIDAAIKTDSLGGINEVWIARVIDKQGIVEIYDSDAPEHIFRTVAREVNLPLVNLGADVVDVAIEFDGTYDQYNIFVSEASPHIFWVERTGSEDIIYTIKWDGVDPAPEPIELARAQLGYLGSGITVGLDPNITV